MGPTLSREPPSRKLGTWGAAVPCFWDRSESVSALTINLPGQSDEYSKMRVPLCAISHAYWGPHTWHDILEVVAWSFCGSIMVGTLRRGTTSDLGLIHAMVIFATKKDWPRLARPCMGEEPCQSAQGIGSFSQRPMACHYGTLVKESVGIAAALKKRPIMV